MKFVNKTMYHFHKKGVMDNMWKVGNNFFIDENFQNNLGEGIVPIDKDLSLIDKKIEYYKLIQSQESACYIREAMLELYREIYHPELISRMNCVYVCDEKSLLYWSNFLFGMYDLFRVTLNGEAFKSCSKFLPDMKELYTFEELKEQIENYWEPNFSDSNNDYFAEYLFQGHIYVNEKLDVEKVRNRYKYGE